MKQEPVCPNCNTNFENEVIRKPYLEEFEDFKHLEYLPRQCHHCKSPHMYLTLRIGE